MGSDAAKAASGGARSIFLQTVRPAKGPQVAQLRVDSSFVLLGWEASRSKCGLAASATYVSYAAAIGIEGKPGSESMITRVDSIQRRLAAAAVAALASFSPLAGQGGAAGRSGGPAPQGAEIDLPLVARFDRSGDGHLDRAERDL